MSAGSAAADDLHTVDRTLVCLPRSVTAELAFRSPLFPMAPPGFPHGPRSRCARLLPGQRAVSVPSGTTNAASSKQHQARLQWLAPAGSEERTPPPPAYASHCSRRTSHRGWPTCSPPKGESRNEPAPRSIRAWSEDRAPTVPRPWSSPPVQPACGPPVDPSPFRLGRAVARRRTHGRGRSPPAWCVRCSAAGMGGPALVERVTVARSRRGEVPGPSGPARSATCSARRFARSPPDA